MLVEITCPRQASPLSHKSVHLRLLLPKNWTIEDCRGLPTTMDNALTSLHFFCKKKKKKNTNSVAFFFSTRRIQVIYEHFCYEIKSYFQQIISLYFFSGWGGR